MTATTRAAQSDQRRRKAPPTPRRKWSKRRTQFVAAVGAVVTLVGLGSALMSYLPRITVDMSTPSNPQDAFSTLAVIQNSGPIPLEDVKFYLGLCSIVFKNGRRMQAENYPNCDRNLSSRFYRMDKWHESRMIHDDKFTMAWGDFMKNDENVKLVSADLSIIVSFRPAYWPFRMEREFGYKTRTKSDGNLEWMNLPRG